MAYHILAINIGSTSTKLAYFEDSTCLFRENISYSAEVLGKFPTFWDQETMRRRDIEAFLTSNGVRLSALDAITAWGGHTEPVEDGVYYITEKLLEQSRSERFGNHPGDLGPRIAASMAKESGRAVALSIDPPTIDEFSPLARYTGLKELTRKSRMQSLNQKATARRYSADIGREYEELNLIVVNMGGGTSVVAHKQGKMVDANNGLDGDGPFATNRAGTLPAGDLIDLCYSGKYTHEQMRRKVTGQGGLVSLLGENDMRVLEDKAKAGDGKTIEVLDAMIYQICKEVGAMAAALDGHVDAILLTGGVAHSDYISSRLIRKISWIAPVKTYAGELEMASLGQMGFEALSGRRPIKTL